MQAGMRGAVVVALVTGAVLAHSGCADSRLVRLPPPPSEQMRSELGPVWVTAGSSDAAMVFAGPAMGAGGGAMKGAWMGFYTPILLGAALGAPLAPLAVGAVPIAAGIALAPVGAVVGAVTGAVAAEPAEKMMQREAVITRTLTDLKTQEYFRSCVVTALREQSPGTATTASEGVPASTTLEVTVEKLGLEDHWYAAINPLLRFVVTERTRVVRASEGTELYAHWLTWRGQFRPLDDWVAEEATLLKQEAARACRDLAESLVDEVFLLYLPGDEQ